MEFVEISTGELRNGWLDRAAAVHRQLRPHLTDDYVRIMMRILAGGARMVVLASDMTVRGIAVWRVLENTAIGRYLYVDDLVVDENSRSQGLGARLLGWLETQAAASQCAALVLDSGVQRDSAHRFYFRAGMKIVCFNFEKQIP